MLAVGFRDLNNRDIEGTATQVINRNSGITAFFIHTVGKRRRCRLVDDALYIQTCNATGVLGRLALRVVKVGRHCHYRFGDRLAKKILGCFLHFLQRLRRNLWRRHLLTVHFNPSIAVIGLSYFVGHHLDVFLHDFVVELTADETLDREQRVIGIRDSLALSRLAHQDFAIVCVSNNGRGGAIAFGVLNNFRLAAVHYCDAGVRCAEVNSYDLTHFSFLQFTRQPCRGS